MKQRFIVKLNKDIIPDEIAKKSKFNLAIEAMRAKTITDVEYVDPCLGAYIFEGESNIRKITTCLFIPVILDSNNYKVRLKQSGSDLNITAEKEIIGEIFRVVNVQIQYSLELPYISITREEEYIEKYAAYVKAALAQYVTNPSVFNLINEYIGYNENFEIISKSHLMSPAASWWGEEYDYAESSDFIKLSAFMYGYYDPGEF